METNQINDLISEVRIGHIKDINQLLLKLSRTDLYLIKQNCHELLQLDNNLCQNCKELLITGKYFTCSKCKKYFCYKCDYPNNLSNHLCSNCDTTSVTTRLPLNTPFDKLPSIFKYWNKQQHNLQLSKEELIKLNKNELITIPIKFYFPNKHNNYLINKMNLNLAITVCNHANGKKWDV